MNITVIGWLSQQQVQILLLLCQSWRKLSSSELVRPNLTLSTIQLNAWAVITSPMLISSFYQLYYNVISLTGLKSHYHSVYYLDFCTTEYLASIMRGQLIILHLMICFSYLLQLNIISLTSPKIALALLFITYFRTFIFTLRKTGPAKNQRS